MGIPIISTKNVNCASCKYMQETSTFPQYEQYYHCFNTEHVNNYKKSKHETSIFLTSNYHDLTNQTCALHKFKGEK